MESQPQNPKNFYPVLSVSDFIGNSTGLQRGQWAGIQHTGHVKLSYIQYIGSFMSAQVLLNLLNKLGKSDKM